MFGISFGRFDFIEHRLETTALASSCSGLKPPIPIDFRKFLIECSIKSNLRVALFSMVFFSLNLNAQNYENKYLKDRFHIAKGLGLHTDFGYSSYQIEVDSSELSSAIDYDVLEYSLGLSYVYGKWMWGIYGKFLVDEVQSNMVISSTQKALNNRATIHKRESAFYINRTLLQKEQRTLKLNLLYRQSSLEAEDIFVSFYHYNSHFNYTTKGVAFSLVYSDRINKRSFYFINLGMLYTKAKVEISESVESRLQDIYIDNRTDALGVKVAVGYSYTFSNSLIFNLRMDGWWLNFDRLKVESLVGDKLPKASLKEQSFTSYTGFSWRF